MAGHGDLRGRKNETWMNRKQQECRSWGGRKPRSGRHTEETQNSGRSWGEPSRPSACSRTRLELHSSRSQDNDRLVKKKSGKTGVVGGVKPRINGEQHAPGTTRCSAGRQGVTSRQAATRLLRCAPALQVTRRIPLTRLVFMAGSELPAIAGPVSRTRRSKMSTPTSCVRHLQALFRRRQQPASGLGKRAEEGHVGYAETAGEEVRERVGGSGRRAK